MEYNDRIWYVYLIQSEADATFYVGMTLNIESRINEHNTGKSRYTKGRMPWKLIHFEAVCNCQQAREKEKYYKTTIGKRELLIQLGYSF